MLKDFADQNKPKRERVMMPSEPEVCESIKKKGNAPIYGRDHSSGTRVLAN